MSPAGGRAGHAGRRSRFLIVLSLVCGAAGGALAAGLGDLPPGAPRSVGYLSGSSMAFVTTDVRIGLQVGVEEVSVYSPAGLRVRHMKTGAVLGRTQGPEALRIGADEHLRAAGRPELLGDGVAAARFDPDGVGAPVFIDGRPYRGSAEVRVAEEAGVTVINVLSLEEYLPGVVPLEIGPRDPEELAAVEAQAVAARTYAVAHLGRHSQLGFDLYGSVDDQAYGGMMAEREEATLAVDRTSGVILVFQGKPVRAFYHSTCGGRTAAVEEVMDREPAPYLRSVSDRSPDGTDYCAASPRYRWARTLTPEELNGSVRDELSRRFGVPASSVGELRAIAVVSRTPSGRVRELAFHGPGARLALSRLDIRLALRGPDGRILNSTDFAVSDQGDGLVELRGRGYGHGAGMCQWGAIGRARAGQSYEQILRAYYSGVELVRAY